MRRLSFAIPSLLIMMTALFFIVNILPGNVALLMLPPDYTHAEYVQVYNQLGLNIPVYLRYLSWLANMLRGNLGISIITETPVSKLIATAFPNTLVLDLFATAVAIAVSIPAGIISAAKRNSGADISISLASYFGISVPSFWLSILMILIFSVYFRILPAGGYVSVFQNPIEGLKDLILPGLTLAAGMTAFLTRMTRSSMLEVLKQDYILTAKAKGLSNRMMLYRHALKNSLIPVITVVGLEFGTLLGGTVIVEEIFRYPGIGTLLYEGIETRDYILVQGVVFLIASLYILVNAIVDVAYMYLDPRVQFESRK